MNGERPDGWPADPAALIAEQERLARLSPEPWHWPGLDAIVGGVFVCFGRGGAGPGQPGDPAWAGAALWRGGSVLGVVTVSGAAPWGYEAGLLALREGPALEAAVRRLSTLPDVLLVDATGRDHPRRAGLALHLGSMLGVPTVGVTRRPLFATGSEAGPSRGDSAPLLLNGEAVGFLVRTKPGTLPLAVHAAWRTDAETAREVVLAATEASRTPEPLRAARQAARELRAVATTRR